jgi:hypothetical protein
MIDASILIQHNKPVVDQARWLDSSHLRDDLKLVVQPFEALAADMLRGIPSSPELTAALRKLVEAKDQMVRAKLYALENNLRHTYQGGQTS